MTRSIWRHSALKTFLTRGLPGSIGKSLLYTKMDHIHADLADILSNQLRQMNKSFSHPSKFLLQYWLILVPKLTFEDLFLADDKGEQYLNVVNKADQQNGKACAYFTQAFILWYLQQLLENDQHFKEQMGFDIETVEAVVRVVLGDGNEVLGYLNYFREEFDLSTIAVQPQDWPLIYIAGVCQLLIKDQETRTSTVKAWDDSIEDRLAFQAFWTEYIVSHKKNALDIASRQR